MRLLVCPVHIKKLIPVKTKYGVRHSCVVKGCTVACWDGSTSTPADDEVRGLRMKAHEVVDVLWKVGGMKRKEVYKRKERKDVHIGFFNKKELLKVIEFKVKG